MSQLKQLWAMTRLNIRLQLTDPAPTLILTVIPLVLIPFMMPAFKSMLLADGYTGATGAEQAVPSMAILFSFLAVQNIIGSFFRRWLPTLCRPCRSRSCSCSVQRFSGIARRALYLH